ncbi:MAG: tail fiber domain-containing protein [Chitinophagales bacterium]
MKHLYFLTAIILVFSLHLNAQNVGIGEAAPSTKLEIKGDSGADLLNVKDNADNSKLFIDDAGRIGIGTTTPGGNFGGHSVASNPMMHFVDATDMAQLSEVLRLERYAGGSDIAAGTGGSIGFYNADNNDGSGEVARISWQHDGGDGTSTEGDGMLEFWTSQVGQSDGNPERRMTIRSNGNIGIGTVEPWEKLDIVGVAFLRAAPSHSTDAEQLRFGREDINVRYHSVHSYHSGNASANYIQFKLHDAVTSTSQSDVLMIRGDGRVGVNTINPAFAFDVTGNARFTDQVSIPLLPVNPEHAASKDYVDKLVSDEDHWDKNNNDIYNNNSGNVGIGTSTPTTPLEIYESETGAVTLFKLTKNEGDIDDNSRIFMDFEFADGNDNGAPQARIAAHANTDKSSGSGMQAEGTADLLFYTASAVSTSDNDLAERMRIRANGGLNLSAYSNGYLRVDGNGDVSAVGTIPSGSIDEVDPTWSGSANTTASVGRTGNVGIGKTSPSTLLDIEGDIQYPINITRIGNNGDVGIEFHDTDENTQTGYFTFEHTNTDSEGNGASFHFKSTETTLGVILDGEGGYYAGSDVAIRSNANSYLTGGNLGLGTSGPNDRLDVSGSITFTGGLKSRGLNYTSTWMVFDEDVYGNSVIIGGGGLTAVGAGESAGQVRTNVAAGSENLYLSADQGMQFYTGMQSGWASKVNAMAISNTGDVAIGGGTSSSYKLRVHGKVRSDGINETSDARLKKNVKSLENALDKVMALRGVNYEWRTEEFPDKEFSEGVELGVIAQEVEKILPEIVDTDDEGYKSVQYSHMVPLLIEAIKEQQAEIDQLKKENCALSTEVQEYRIFMDQLDKQKLLNAFGKSDLMVKKD